MGYVTCMGPCCNCGRVFTYNPNKVPSIRVKNGKPDPEGSREPVCEPCMTTGNERRKAQGLEPFPVNPDAYEALDEREL